MSKNAEDGKQQGQKPERYRARTPRPNSFPSGTAASPGGAERDRTDDLLLAKQALSQLSYSPILSFTPFQQHR